MEICEQRIGDLWTRESILVDKRTETCGQDSGDLWPKRGETCGQESEDLWKRKQRLVDKGVENCGKDTREVLTREWRLVDKRSGTSQWSSERL